MNINESAYYLVDNIQFYEATDSTECGCTPPEPVISELSNNNDLEERLSIGDTVILKSIYFEFDSYELNYSSLTELDLLSNYLKTNPKLNITISGHTDDEGTGEYNLDLSKKRANAVGHWLRQDGIHPNRITCKGFGSKYQISELQNENRRVEVFLSE